MHSTKTKFADDVDSALKYCHSAIVESGVAQTVVLGGHYMLMYDQATHSLRPAIWQEHENGPLKDFSQLVGANFPLNTIQIALKLIKILRNELKAWVFILVNDQKFQNPSFQPKTFNVVREKTGLLRKKYFKEDTLPSSYSGLFLKYSFAKDVLLDNSNPTRDKNSILPRRTAFFSEKVLQRSFQRKTSKKLYQVQGQVNEDDIASQHLHKLLSEQVCMVEHGSCGCTGLIIELIGQIFSRQIYGIVLMVPDECAEAVNIGIVVAQEFYRKTSIIICMHNLGGTGSPLIELKALKNLQIDFHSY